MKKMKIKKYITVVIGVFLFVSCSKETTPKPDGYLRLSYPKAVYQKEDSPYSFSYEKNREARMIDEGHQAFRLDYPQMKASIYMNYRKVTKNNLDSLLRDAQKLTYNHNIKADDIQEKIFINREAKVYGMFYKIIGNAATNVQFYATDSINHFVVGSLYFYAKPNFDSIYPATHYIETDMRHLMESIHWK